MADVKISELTDAGALDGTELVELVQSTNSVKATTGNVAKLALPVVVDEGTTARTALPAHAGNYTRFTNSGAKTYTFDGAETYPIGSEYNVRNANTGNLTLTPANGFTFNAPSDGTLVVPPHGTVTVKIVATDVADVFGVTVPA